MKLKLIRLGQLFAGKPGSAKGETEATEQMEPRNGEMPAGREVLKLSYEHVCESYHNISDFRGKLLALLPLATGTGGILLLRQHDDVQALGPIGLFGVAVAVGLFMYEARGIQRCHRLEQQARVLECRLKLNREEGQFLGDPGRFLGIVGPPAAGVITYGAVVSAWLYVAGVGFGWWNEMRPANSLWLVVGYLSWLAISLTFISCHELREKTRREERHQG